MNKKISKLAVSNKNVLFVFDFDGTMLEAKYGKENILGCDSDDGSVLKRDLEKNAYDGVKPLKKVQVLVELLSQNNKTVKVLTKIHNGIEVLNKIDYLNREYPTITKRDFIGVIEYEHKGVVLDYYSNIYDDVVYIDDHLDTLIQIENNFANKKNIHCFHISSLFIDN